MFSYFLIFVCADPKNMEVLDLVQILKRVRTIDLNSVRQNLISGFGCYNCIEQNALQIFFRLSSIWVQIQVRPVLFFPCFSSFFSSIKILQSKVVNWNSGTLGTSNQMCCCIYSNFSPCVQIPPYSLWVVVIGLSKVWFNPTIW